jgi:hypothetical protein
MNENIMTYIRPTNPEPITPEEKSLLIGEYLSFYQEISQRAVEENDFSALNVKLPRSAASDFLNGVGILLLDAAKNSLAQKSDLHTFLAENPLPNNLHKRLPDEFRAYCLLLNSLKQWVAAESAATDRWLLGGTVREKLRNAADCCMVTGKALERIELHHPVRDGRPPIPLSHDGHQRLESATESDTNDPIMAALRLIRAKGNRSWKALRDGCLSHLGEDVFTRTKNSLNSAKSFSTKAQNTTGKTPSELIEWLDENQLGL